MALGHPQRVGVPGVETDLYELVVAAGAPSVFDMAPIPIGSQSHLRQAADISALRYSESACGPARADACLTKDILD